ncbi:MAG: DUF4411 family protein [Selenomonadaceae bacterium]|nr:DUF4411 family protein [Selenomonadaceae bacterium]
MSEKIKYCLDTNIVSDFLRGNETVVRNINTAIAAGNQIFIPTLVYYEIVRGLKAGGKTRKLVEFLSLYKNFPHLFFDRDNYKVIEKATEIYVQLHRGQQIEDDDIFIAAIALVNDCTLVTANVKYFERVGNLQAVNWRDN